MGATLSDARDKILASQSMEKERTLEQLSVIINLADARLDKYRADLQKCDGWRRTMRLVQGHRVTKTENANETADSEGLSKIVNESFFGMAKKHEGQATTLDDKVLSGFTKTVQTGLKDFLNNTKAGEIEEEKYFFVVQYHTIVRVNVKLWRYNPTNRDAIAGIASLYGYVFRTSVVDVKNMDENELTCLRSAHVGDDEMEAYVNSLLTTRQKSLEKIANSTQDLSRPQ